MSDDTTPDQHPVTTGDTPDEAPVAATEEERPSHLARLRGRAGTVGKGALVALLAGLVLGSAGGFAVGAVAVGHDGHDRDARHGRPFEEGDGADRGPGQIAPGGGVPPGQLPPSTAPEDSSDLNS